MSRRSLLLTLTLTLLLALTLLAACGQGELRLKHSHDLTAKLSPEVVIPGLDAVPPALSREVAVSLSGLGLGLLRENYQPGGNALVSPVSVAAALSLVVLGAREDSLSQMEEALDLSWEDLNGFMTVYLQDLQQQAKANPQQNAAGLNMANAVWFREGPDFTPDPGFLQLAADTAQAGVYSAPFDQTTVDEVNQWVGHHTQGMINQLLDELTPDDVLLLVNALAFEADWQSVYEPAQIHEELFHPADGPAQPVRLMYSQEAVYIEDAQACGFIKPYAGGDYAFVAILPQEGLALGDYLAGLDGVELQELLQTQQQARVDAALPQFEGEYQAQLSQALAALGMSDVFDSQRADLSGLGHSELGPLYISRVLHKTRIQVDGQGTKAAAATLVDVAVTESAMEEPQAKTVRLDRPFIYLLLDCRTNLPLFIGAAETM